MFTTIDVDRNRVEERVRIIASILTCSSIQKVFMERSTSGRGWHITIICSKEVCLKCRKQFDDPIRFDADTKHREPYQQNVLFERKEQHYPEVGIVRFFEKGEKPRVVNT